MENDASHGSASLLPTDSLELDHGDFGSGNSNSDKSDSELDEESEESDSESEAILGDCADLEGWDGAYVDVVDDYEF